MSDSRPITVIESEISERIKNWPEDVRRFWEYKPVIRRAALDVARVDGVEAAAQAIKESYLTLLQDRTV